MTQDRWLSPKEVKDFLNISIYEVGQLIKLGMLPSRKTPGGHHRVLQSVVDRYAQQMKEGEEDGDT